MTTDKCHKGVKALCKTLAKPCPALVHHFLLHCQHPSTNSLTRAMALHLVPTPFRQSPRLKGMRHCPKADRIQTFSWPLHKTSALRASPALNPTNVHREVCGHDLNHPPAQQVPQEGLVKGQSVSTKYCRSMRHQALLCPMLHSAVI